MRNPNYLEKFKKEFITRGLDSDQTVSAIKAAEKMLNIIT